MMVKEMRVIVFAVAIMLPVVSVANAQVVVVDFDDLWADYTLSGTTYAGLTWEWGNEGIGGNPGEWGIPPDDVDTYPYSEPYCAANGWGSSLMGVGFPETVNVLGAYFAAAGGSTWWTPGIRVHGYLGSTEVATTDWFNDINETPDWFAINLNNVDRIVIESLLKTGGPGSDPAGFYGMDNLTYVPEPATISLLALGGLLLRRRK